MATYPAAGSSHARLRFLLLQEILHDGRFGAGTFAAAPNRLRRRTGDPSRPGRPPG